MTGRDGPGVKSAVNSGMDSEVTLPAETQGCLGLHSEVGSGCLRQRKRYISRQNHRSGKITPAKHPNSQINMLLNSRMGTGINSGMKFTGMRRGGSRLDSGRESGMHSGVATRVTF